MSEQDERPEDEREDQGSADRLPFLPSDDDDSALGDTDQHSDAPTPPRTGR